MVILLVARLSTHILMLPSFLGTSGAGIRAQTLPYQTLGQQVIYLALDFLSLLGVHTVGRLVGEGGAGYEVYLVLYGSLWG